MVGVYNSSGTKLVTFRYDAYGNCTVSGDANFAQWCKIRYRGYYFDTETGFYWVQTRYYNPEWCRWISPDTLDYLDPETAHGLNLYAYCGNDPVNFTDPSGHFALLLFLGTIFVSAVAGAIDGGISAKMCGQDFWKGFAAGAIGGALGGVISAIGIVFSPFANTLQLLGRAASSTTYNLLNELFQTGSISTDNLGIYFADVTMDVIFSMLYVDRINNISSAVLSSMAFGFVDSAIDLAQTKLFLSPQAQREIKRLGNKRSNIISSERFEVLAL